MSTSFIKPINNQDLFLSHSNRITIVNRDNAYALISQDALKRVTKEGPRILITGESGSGKSFLTKRLISQGFLVKELDSIGYMKENKWIIDLDEVKKIPSDVILSGTSDNIRELIDSFERIKIFYLRTTIEQLRLANLEKMLKKDWTFDLRLKRLKWTDTEWEAHIQRDYNRMFM